MTFKQKKQLNFPHTSIILSIQVLAIQVHTAFRRTMRWKSAAHVLNVGNKVGILIGAGAADASEEVIQIANLLNAGVAKALLGKSALPDDLPFLTGTIGFFGATATENMMKECDTLLLIGTSFPYAEFLPRGRSGTGGSNRYRRTDA